ncbi:gem-associated protein 8-like isoform X1 [Palaemon carinicauda]|uniref:gem-associated protein 8-like isoform X2 n=2 Tax=Palaemon carinicauda TaxID=392227 RepID=UPI0035B5A89B
MASKMDEDSVEEDKTVPDPWFMNSKFARFWYHYNTMMMAAHRDAILKAKYRAAHKKASLIRMLAALKGTSVESRTLNGNKSSLPSRTPSEIARAKRNKKKRKRKKRNRRMRELAKQQNNQEGASDTECLYSQMKTGMKINDTEDEGEDLDVGEDMLEFLEKSQKHRMEWRVRKASIKNGGTGMFLTPVSMQDTIAQEHPDVTRNREMKQLYGLASPRIHAMETAIQLSFDRISTLHRPQYWPNIPIHVMFQ